MPSLSIIIPVYNVEKYLRQCLDSVLVDNAFTGQVICVNDGSTDGSLAILDEYVTKYTNVEVISQPNAGLSAARNCGINHATGDYVMFVDSDDWLFPDVIQKVLEQIDGEDVLYYNAKKYYEETSTFDGECAIDELKHIDGQTYFATIYNKRRNLPYMCVVGGFYSRSFLMNNHLSFALGIYHEDNYFTPQVLLAAKNVSSINVYLYVYRIRQGSIMTTRGEKNIKDLLFIIRNLYTLYNKTNNVEELFYQELFEIYVNIINTSYHIAVPIHRFWYSIDSKIMFRCAHNDYHRKIAKLTFFSPRIAYKFMQNGFSPIIRKVINRFL